MNFLICRPRLVLSALAIICLGVITLIYPSNGLVLANDDSLDDGKLVTIHDRGVEKVFVSRANTIGEALKEANISIDAKDIVEPFVDQEMVASDYQINVYRARPVVVVDGAVKTKVMTAYQTAVQIAESANIKLYDEDRTELSQADGLVNGGAGLQLTVDRATPFNFDLYGETKVVRTQSDTVAEMLKEKNIKMGDNDRLSVDLNTKIIDNSSIRLWREGKQTISVEEEIAYEVDKIRDGDREIGYKEVRTVGEKGTRTVTYELLIEKGKEVSRTEIASLTTKEPKKQIEVIGVKRKVGNPAENKQYARAIMGDYGFGDDQWTCLENLWSHESGWNQYVVNSSSGAYGIPQALPGSKMGAGWQDDPAVQINWGLKYIKDRYKTPCGAYNQWRSENWY